MAQPAQTAGRARPAWVAAVLAAAFLVALSVELRTPPQDAVYVNQDATWHVLHTLQCYDNMPNSEHLFLPLVTPGDDARYMMWGATPEGMNGIHFYTSFWAPGFLLPWGFANATGLGYTPQMLYWLNSLLLALSVAATCLLMVRLFGPRLGKAAPLLVPLTALLYLFQPEIMQSQGAVYWHQSVTQLVLVCQLYCFSRYRQRWGKAAFYVLAFLICQLEWTGYVANVGYALLMLAWGVPGEDKQPLPRRFARAAALGGLSAAALFGIVLHYLQRVPASTLFSALLGSYAVRGDGARDPVLQYFVMLFRSLRPLWTLLPVLLALVLLVPRAHRALPGLLRAYAPWLFVSAFPMLENLILRQHALEYTYDRMKAVYPLLIAFFLLFACLYGALEGARWRGVALAGTLAACLVFGGVSLADYLRPHNYYVDRDEDGYLVYNQLMAQRLLAEYPRAYTLYGFPVPVRGYTNLTFGGGGLELVNQDTLREEALARGMRYAVYVDARGGVSNTYHFVAAVVMDLKTGEVAVCDPWETFAYSDYYPDGETL